MAARFGVDQSQVLRDHLISHLLAAVSAVAGDSVIRLTVTAAEALAAVRAGWARLVEPG
ncbi:hypothetical protein ACVGVM_29660 (plasmid) [Pseudonocardia bannensis]|uniref:hypothetical protein n=1 Tax=Pseudonocardia TaxID=1847 RepID=UPI001B7CF8FD|nr:MULTISPECIES: hypothetical protein [Pseudonocardia]